MTTYLIREMAPSERPRERLKALGPEALTEPELIAILLRTGVKGRSAVELAQQLLKRHGNTLEELSHVPLAVLTHDRDPETGRNRGVGETKAIQLKAGFELARRLTVAQRSQKPTIDAPEKAVPHLREEFRALDREAFRALLLDTKNGLIRISKVSLGSLNASIVEPREVFKDAILASACSVVLAHNHPSGDPTPSAEDIAITKRLVKAGELLNIAVLDHIIVGQRSPARPQEYASLKELGLM